MKEDILYKSNSFNEIKFYVVVLFDYSTWSFDAKHVKYVNSLEEIENEKAKLKGDEYLVVSEHTVTRKELLEFIVKYMNDPDYYDDESFEEIVTNKELLNDIISFYSKTHKMIGIIESNTELAKLFKDEK